VVLQSTTYPGTTDEIVRPSWNNRAWLDVDFDLAWPGTDRSRQHEI
jgi:UDP-N-acetyl-D-mannosaminuronate dehydrogenase